MNMMSMSASNKRAVVIGGGAAGVSKYLTQLKGELVQTMVLTGCQDIAAITGDALFAQH